MRKLAFTGLRLSRLWFLDWSRIDSRTIFNMQDFRLMWLMLLMSRVCRLTRTKRRFNLFGQGFLGGY